MSTPPHPLDILACTTDRWLADAARAGIARDRALTAYRAAFREGRCEPPLVHPDLAPVVREARESDGTVKFIQRHGDGLEIESVIIPGVGRGGRSRTTLCVSSQIGCAMGCTFCETAQMGLLRNLDARDIVGQWFAARHVLRRTIDNVVFMGMGEPLDNVDAVADAIRILTDHNGPAVAASRITVSTVGRVRGIERLADLAREPGLGSLRLAVSVNAPNDRIRTQIMPINRAEPMDALMNAMRRWRGRVLVEYVLIPGINDDPAHAAEVCAWLAPLDATVNVIPYNPRRESPWPAPAEDDVERFVATIAANGRRVKRRQTHGRTVMAACGQLGNERIRRRRYVGLTRTTA